MSVIKRNQKTNCVTSFVLLLFSVFPKSMFAITFENAELISSTSSATFMTNGELTISINVIEAFNVDSQFV